MIDGMIIWYVNDGIQYPMILQDMCHKNVTMVNTLYGIRVVSILVWCHVAICSFVYKALYPYVKIEVN